MGAVVTVASLFALTIRFSAETETETARDLAPATPQLAGALA